jgi:flagellar motor protein MotB
MPYLSSKSSSKIFKARKVFGGAWKVAYADFVTGMMSLFLVLWILSQDEEVIIATTRFFRDPYMAGVPKSTPVEQKDARPGSMVDQIVGRSDTTMRNTNDTTSIDIDV